MNKGVEIIDINELIELFFTGNEDISVLRSATPHLNDGNADLNRISKLLPRIIKHACDAGQKSDTQIKDYTEILVDLLVFLISKSTDHAIIFIGDILKALEDVTNECQTTMYYEVAVTLFQNMSILASATSFIIKFDPSINFHASFKASTVLPAMFDLSVNAPREVVNCLLEASTQLCATCTKGKLVKLNVIFFKSLSLSIMKAIIFILYTDSIHKYTLADEMGKCLNLLNEQIQFCELLDTHESGQIVDKLYYSLGIQQVPSIQEVLLDSAFALMLNGTFPTWVSELLEKTKDKTDFRITSMMCKGLIDNMSSSCMSSYMKTD